MPINYFRILHMFEFCTRCSHSRDCPLRLQLVDSNSDRPVAIDEQLIALGFAKLSRKFEDSLRASDCDEETDGTFIFIYMLS